MRGLRTACCTGLVTTLLVASPAAAAPENPFDGPVGGSQLGVTPRVLAGGGPPPPAVKAAAWMVADLDTGEVLAAKAPHAKLRPASTLKTLTALVLLPRLDKSDRIMGLYDDAAIEGSKVGVHPGLMYSVDQLFSGLFLASGNDAVHALVRHDQGGLPATVRRMNAKAAELGAFDTTVVDPTGLDADGQLTSAYDLALIARAGLQRADFRRYAATRTVHYPKAPEPDPDEPETPPTAPVQPVGSYQVGNQNRLIWDYPGALGVKTGYTTLAKNTYVGAAGRDGHRLVVTLLLSPPGVTKDGATLLDWAFAHRSQLRPIGTLVTPADVSRARGGGSKTAVKSGSDKVAPATPAPPAQAGLPSRSAVARIPLWFYPLIPLFAAVFLARRRLFPQPHPHRRRR